MLPPKSTHHDRKLERGFRPSGDDRVLAASQFGSVGGEVATDRTRIDDRSKRAVEVVYENSGTITFDQKMVPRQAKRSFVNDDQIRMLERCRFLGQRRAPNNEGEARDG